MSENASSIRVGEPLPETGRASHELPLHVSADASSGDRGVTVGNPPEDPAETPAGGTPVPIYSQGGTPPPIVPDDQPTVISNRPPAIPGPVSEAAKRILMGRILQGDRLGHFELIQYVGGGGMGRVFRAQDTRLARTVALKILPPEQVADRETLLRFQNEAQSAARLNHDNIVRVYYVGEDNGLHYIVFEFIEGVNIRELVETKGPLPLAEAISYTLQAADALAHAAERKVVHRDIKPSNLLITPQGQVKLIDMGLARLRESDNADLTASGVTLGTFDYISPEQARDPRCADVRSDVYSLGCTFFYMLTGRPPFPGGTVLQKLLQHQGDQPPDVCQLRPELPEGVTRLLRKMLAKDPRHRYRDPADLVHDLLLLSREVGLRPLGPGGRVWLPPREPALWFLQRHLPWALPLVSLLVIVVGLHFYWSYSSSNTQLPPLGPPLGGYVAPDLNAATDDNRVSRQPESPADGKTVKPISGQPGGAEMRRPSLDSPKERANLPEKRQGGDAAAKTERPWDSAWLPALEPTAPSHGPGENHENGPSAPGAIGVPSSKRAGVLVVSSRIEDESSFPTLGAAFQAASDGDVIELRYDGPREEQPIRLRDRRVTVRAADGCQPILLFQPDADVMLSVNRSGPDRGGAAADIEPISYGPRSMLTVDGGRLTLINVAIELEVPRENASRPWSLFEIQGTPSLRLEKSSLSIRNASDQGGAYHPDVAFFRVRSGPEETTPAADKAAEASESTVIGLVDCIARGEAVLLGCEGFPSVHFDWNNGLLLTTERLVSATDLAQTPRSGGSLRIDLRHLTAIMRSGFCRWASGPGMPHQFSARINCSDSILQGAPGSSLIEQVADEATEDLRRRIAWSGDRNLYNGFDVFWILRRLDARTTPDLMTFEAWKLYWGPQRENLAKLDRVDWRTRPVAGLALSRHAPTDYVLNGASENPAVGTASDGNNLGCFADRLPSLPSDAGRTGLTLEKRGVGFKEESSEPPPSKGPPSPKALSPEKPPPVEPFDEDLDPLEGLPKMHAPVKPSTPDRTGLGTGARGALTLPRFSG